MGSTGSGNLTDYDHPSLSANQGVSSGGDNCKKSFYTFLEDVPTCTYFKSHNDIPEKETVGHILFHNPRLAVADKEGLIMGYLPTKYNYIKICMEASVSYTAVVAFASLNPIATISVDVSPI